jgi:hypothetical protein
MPIDFNEAREIVEAAKKRGMIRAAGEDPAPPSPPERKKEAGSLLPDWLQEGLLRPAEPIERPDDR